MTMQSRFTVKLDPQRRELLDRLSDETRLSRGEIVKRMMDEASANESFVRSLYPVYPEKPVCERGDSERS